MGRRPRHDRRDPTVVVRPNAWNIRGEAVVFVDGRKPLRVWSGIPGEEGLVRVEHQGQNEDVARWLKSRNPHPQRVEPPCDRYNPCGGCPLMHLDAEGQAEARRRQVRVALERAGVISEARPLEVEALVPCPAGSSEYRHVVKLQAGWSDRRHRRLGAFGRDRRLVPIPGCLAVTAQLRDAMRVIAHHFIELDIYPYDPGRDHGTLRYVVARQSAATGEILVTLVAGRNHKLLRDLADAIERNCADVVGVHLHLNDEPGNNIYSRDEGGAVRSSRLSGKRLISDTLAGVPYLIGPGDFFQTNPSTADRLYQDVIEIAADGGSLVDVPVVDLYSGVGGFALPLALRSGWALGVESVEGAVVRAREAASAAGISAEFTHGEVAEVLPDVQRRLRGRRPLVIVNPARRGLEDEVADQIEALEPRRLIYISCNPQALARDLAGFVERGWSVERVRPYDMFPNTSHVEVVASLLPPDGGQALPQTRGPRRKVVR